LLRKVKQAGGDYGPNITRRATHLVAAQSMSAEWQKRQYTDGSVLAHCRLEGQALP